MRRHPGPGRCPFSQVVQTLVPSWCHPGSLSNADSRIHPHSGCTKVPPHEVTGPHIARHTDAQTRVQADQHTPYTLTLTLTQRLLLHIQRYPSSHTRVHSPGTFLPTQHMQARVQTHRHAFVHTDTYTQKDTFPQASCRKARTHIHTHSPTRFLSRTQTDHIHPCADSRWQTHPHAGTLSHTLPGHSWSALRLQL